MVQLETTLESDKVRNLIDLLRSKGLDKHIDLPQVAVMGDTSTGKSSLLSALSGIVFPASDKLTTRCPTQMQLSYSEKFKGTVHLQRYHPRSIEDEMELSCIQDATGAIEKLTQKLIDEGQFISNDSIVITLEGPELPNLTLTDLPGLVRTTEDEENVGIVENTKELVKRYMYQSRTIVLAVIPANVDFHNSEILQNAQVVDPDGLRTIAVITKPDLIDEGAEASVIDLLLNKRRALHWGYHCVKLRGQKELNKKTSLGESIENEAKFFNNNSIWKDVPKDLVGIPKLKTKLVELLQDIIMRSLPTVIEEIDQQLRLNEIDLAKLGVAIEQPIHRQMEYSKWKDIYLSTVQAGIKGRYGDYEIYKEEGNRITVQIRKLEHEFQQEIRDLGYKTKFEDSFIGEEVEAGMFVEVFNDGEWKLDIVESVDYKVKCGQKWYWPYEYSCGNHEIGDRKGVIKRGSRIVISNRECFIEGFEMVIRLNSMWYPDSRWRPKQVPNIYDIQELIQSNRGENLAIFPSYDVFKSLAQEKIRQWEKPAKSLYDRTVDTFKSICKNICKSLECNQRLFATIEKTSDQVIAEMSIVIHERIKEKIAMEMKPYTLNHYLYDEILKLRNKPIHDALESLESMGDKKVPITYVKNLLSSSGIGFLSNEDQEARDIDIALNSYIKLAQKRFIDNIPMLIQTYFIDEYTAKMKYKLIRSDDDLEKIFRESSHIQHQRIQLQNKLKELKESKELVQVY